MVNNSKKGFTMIELLAAVVILGLLSVLAIVSVNRLINNANKESDEDYEKMLKIAAQSYMESNKNSLPKKIGKIQSVTSVTLKDRNYLKEEKGGCVEVKKINNAKYEYTVKLKGECASDDSNSNVCTPSAVVEKVQITDKDLHEIDMTNPESQSNIQEAYLYIVMNGGKVDGEKDPKIIQGYGYSILIKNNTQPDYYEVFNSGTLNGNGRREITVKRPLKEFIDVTEANAIKANVFVINEEGCTNEDPENPKTPTIHDTVPPVCENISGAAANANDWYNKQSTGTGRQIKLRCNDGKGSGCVRDEYIRTWPNDYQQDAEWAYVQVKDNAGNVSVDTSIANSKDICNAQAKTNDTCRVRINVDKTNPSIKVLGAYQASASGTKNTNDNRYSSQSKTWTDGTGNGEIGTNEYNNISDNAYWMNKTEYPNGVVYEIEISDNIHLDRWTWETNAPFIDNANTNAYKAVSVSNDGYRQEVANSTVNWGANCGTKSKKILIGFKEEGRRRGVLTVYDKAGNKLILTISANLDRTPPVKPIIEYSNGYKTSTWVNIPITASIPSRYKDDQTSGPSEKRVTLSGWSHFIYDVKKDYDASYSNIAKGQEFTFNKAGGFQGKHQIQFKSYDMAGNESVASGYGKVWVDFTYPVCNVSKNVSASRVGTENWVGAGSTVTVTAKCMEGKESTKESGCYNGTGTNDIKETFSHAYTTDINTGVAGAVGDGNGGKIRDVAGNTTTCAANQLVKIDTKPPQCIVTGQSTSCKWATTRTINRTCTDPKAGNVVSGCTSASKISDKYQENNKTVRTVAFQTYDISDKAANTVHCTVSNTKEQLDNGNYQNLDNGGKLDVCVDRQAPSCSGKKGHDTHTDGTHKTATQGNPDGVTIDYTCSDAGVGGYKCPNDITKAPYATTTQTPKVTDALGNSMTCKVVVSSKTEKRYRKKDAAATCTSSCCGYKTCRTSACGCQTYNSKCNIGTCGGYYRYKSFTASSLKSCGGGYAIYNYSKYSYKQKYDCEWHANYEYCKYRTVTTYSIHCRKQFCRTCRHVRHGCQTYYSCAASACGAKKCTSVKCCGYKCGTSNWNAWGGKDNGCKSDSRPLYY